VTTLSSIAHETSEVGIGSSLPDGYSRSPALIGRTAAPLQEASDGRLRVGLGPSGPRVIEATMEALVP
jgi:alkanesulfonate monooxygenase SsuD/methylene tetrahydromethanopterin reductase-like flavin-dependent oxidoreductase (luciferase family)